MTRAQIAAREQIKRLTLADVGRGFITAAEWLLAFWRGDAKAAKKSLRELPIDAKLRQMLSLAVDTAVARRQRQLDYELNGPRIRRACRQNVCA